jgi:hypothetical protein
MVQSRRGYSTPSARITIAPGIIAPNGPPPMNPRNPQPSIIATAGNQYRLSFTQTE